MQLHYKRYGTGGHPLIILHGLLGSGGNWHTLASRAFSPHFDVYLVDQRNHGRSPHRDEMDYPAMARDAARFMDEHGLRSAYVMGHSMGGKTAMELALAEPERVGRLVVVDIAPRAYPPQHLDLLDALRSIDPGAHASRKAIDERLAERVSSAPIRQFLMKNLAYDPDEERYYWQSNLEAMYANYQRLSAEIEGGRVYNGPALFIRGGKSGYVTEADEPAMRTLFPQAEVVTLPEAGHWIHADSPGPFTGIVLDFLST